MCSDFREKVLQCECQLQKFAITSGLKKISPIQNEIVNVNGIASLMLNDDFNDEHQIVVIDPSKCYTSSDEEEVEEENSPNVSFEEPKKSVKFEKPIKPRKVNSKKIDSNEQFKNVYFCKYCEAAYSSREQCQFHENHEHDIQAPYGCTFCPFRSTDRATLIQHIKYSHDREKPFICVQCGKRYNRRSDLKKHAVAHTGVRPFACIHCPKKFSRNTNLRKHMKVHQNTKPLPTTLPPMIHSDNGIQKLDDTINHLQENSMYLQFLQSQNASKSEPKKFSCDKCSKKFNKLSQLSNHKNIHSTPGVTFTCQTCTKTFKSKRELDRHSLVHATQFQCTICSKRFLRRDKLLRHENIHKSKRLAALPESAFLPENLKRHGQINYQTSMNSETQQLQQQQEQQIQSNQSQSEQQMMRPQFYAEYDLSQTN